ncbi:MAG: NAD(P)-dependent alcohol dehydrogenase [Sporocytophaga sp.]|uniref:NAD(P)-dependent alcohol dehydrogenase n=1 Tax=Sporocytophaga sp. TaxID=2231183 RepID=UPI001B1BA5BC|nr:NAD(P)-dependent alcohol dehydrogenase [Sporocytophaga sp.]MBO9699899.1 NAD(P)-dependent alcohol dehydrogenase [Sporocytophaga sp.]
MKAISCLKYGLSELKLEEVEKPVPRDNEVLLEVHASSATTHNLMIIEGKPFFVRLLDSGLVKPRIKIPGSDISGRVVMVGKDVTKFKPGDEVFGVSTAFGAYAEYTAVPEHELVPKPVNISFEEAAAVPQGSLVALQALRDKGGIQKGQKVLIFGASGGIGSFAVQIAKYFGAEVTGVCSSRNFDMLYTLGADHLIDYTKQDYTKNGQTYDLIFAIAYRSIFDHKRALKPNGVYVSAGGPSVTRIFQDMLIGPMVFKRDGKKLVGGWAVNPNAKDLLFVKELIEAGRIKPVVDRCYPLSETAKALQHYGTGHPGGKVVIAVQHSTKF